MAGGEWESSTTGNVDCEELELCGADKLEDDEEELELLVDLVEDDEEELVLLVDLVAAAGGGLVGTDGFGGIYGVIVLVSM